MAGPCAKVGGPLPGGDAVSISVATCFARFAAVFASKTLTAEIAKDSQRTQRRTVSQNLRSSPSSDAFRYTCPSVAVDPVVLERP